MKLITRAGLGAGFVVGVLGVALISSGCGGGDGGEAAAATAAQARTAKKCSLATLRGNYAFGFTGQVDGIGPVSASGITTFNGSGRTSIRGFLNTTTNAPPIQATLPGTYTVDADRCTGSATYTAPPPGLFNRFTEVKFEGVIVGKGREIRYLITTPGIVIAGSSVRQ
jgi:hypothetical protein